MLINTCMAIIATIAAIFGFFLNLVVLTVRFLKWKSSTFQLLLASLAFNDMALSIAFAFLAPLLYADFQWIYPQFACKLLFPSITILMSVNVGCMFVVSYERYRAVIHPFKPRFSIKKTLISLAVIWILSIGITVPNIIVLRMQHYRECRETWNDTVVPKIYSACLLVFGYVTPLVSIVTMHVLIWCRVRQSGSKISRFNAKNCVTKIKRRRNMQIVKLLVSITVAFSIFVLPTKIYYLMWDFAPNLVTEEVSRALKGYKSLYYLHVVVNPILYSLTDKEFRIDFVDVLRCKVRRRNDYSTTHTA